MGERKPRTFRYFQILCKIYGLVKYELAGKWQNHIEYQRGTQNPAKHLRRKVLRKKLTVFGIIFAKRFTLNFWQGSEYASEYVFS